jgi:2-polyprenyl-3-methyl-5-hydroxy-6-metoxy-1,4-benzoquinol methylase
MEHAPATCILCHCPNRSLLFQKEEWTVFRCSHCGLGFLDPRPNQEELNKIYKKSYFQNQYDQGLKLESPEMKRRITQEDHRIKFFRLYKKRGRVIDLGCGLGYFLLACRMHGYDVAGVDISDYAASYVENELKIPIKIGTLEEIKFENASIDIITMWHFLEHTSNPVDYLKKVATWLKPDGLLVVDVPNYEGTDAQKTWNEWVGWQLPYHFSHFTPKTLTDILLECGFKTIRTKDYHSEYIKNHLKRIPGISLLARLIAKGFSGCYRRLHLPPLSPI